MNFDFEQVRQSFESALKLDPRYGLTVSAQAENSEIRVTVRHQDVDEMRGFDVVGKPTESEHKTPNELGQQIAEVVERELGYGQLPARGEDGTFKQIVV